MADDERTFTTPIERGSIKSLKLIEIIVNYQTDDGEIGAISITPTDLEVALQRDLTQQCEDNLKEKMGSRQ